MFTLYTHLKELRESLGMTQEEFGKSVGIAKSTYNNYEKGIREPKSDFWITVAKKYDVTIDYLMGYSDDPHGTVAGTSRIPPLTARRLEEILKQKSASSDPFVEGDTFLGGHMTVASIHASEDGGISVNFEIDGTGLSATQVESILNALNQVEKEAGLPIEYLSEVINLFGKMAKGTARIPAVDNSEMLSDGK